MSQTSRSARSSVRLYTVPISVGWEMYTTRGCTICSSVCASTTACTPSGSTFPSREAAMHTLCPLPSTVPVSCTLMWPPCAAIAASYGRMNALRATMFALVPPIIICTAASFWPHFSRIRSAACRLYASKP